MYFIYDVLAGHFNYSAVIEFVIGVASNANGLFSAIAMFALSDWILIFFN